MEESTTIRGRQLGALKTAAKRVGLSLEEYQRRIALGLKWCYRCDRWCPRTSFNTDRHRGDGRAAICRFCHSGIGRAKYIQVTGPRRYGPNPNAPVDGNKRQARRRINVEVRTGRRAHPNDLPCVSCGHIWEPGERRHEYHHHLGYMAAHHYDVIPLCTSCHHEEDK